MKKKLLLSLVFVFYASGLFANGYEENYEAAVKYKNEANYVKAVKYFIKALKAEEKNHVVARKTCYAIADCFVKDGKTGSAIKFLKIAISNYGATLSDIQKEESLDGQFVLAAWGIIESEYNDLRRDYVANLNNIDRYLESREYVSNAK
jgi:tetratricopeptide (TPR) repeat protein